MNERIVISHGHSGILLINRLKHDLMKHGFYVWDGYQLSRGSDEWWAEFEKVLDKKGALIALISSLEDPTPQAGREIKAAYDHGVEVIPLLFEGNMDDLTYGSFTSEVIDISSADKYQAGLEVLYESLYRALGINTKAGDPNVEREIEEMVIRIAGIRWIRIVSVDAFTHPFYRFDYGNVKRNTPIDLEEDRRGPLGAVALSLSERILSESGLGIPRFTVLVGEDGTFFMLPIGDGQQWLLVFAVKDYPPVDEIIRYFAERDYFSHILPLLTYNP